MARLLPGAAGLLKLFYFGSFFIVALDGSGAHSPYVVGLLEHLAELQNRRQNHARLGLWERV